MKAKGFSIVATSRRAQELVADPDWSLARRLDVGAGRGAFRELLGAGALHRRGVARRRPQVWEASRGLMRSLGGWSLRTGRTAILFARWPEGTPPR